MFSPLEQFDVILYTHEYFPIPFLNLILPMILFFVLFLFIGRYLKENLRLIPTLLQYICESILNFIFNLITQQVGKNGYIYLPLIFTLFNFILIMNLFSLLPFGMALTSHIIMIF
jgi:F0F1-type ATP synthase membrane subunit a